MKIIIDFSRINFVTLWFMCVYAAFLIYCIKNWEIVTNFDKYSGNTVMFYSLIALTFLPFIKKFKFRDIEGNINNPLEQNLLQAEANLVDAANKTPNINMNVNIQNKYNDEIKDITKNKEVANAGV
ncbi:hypothetical protein IJX73_02230 [bacterium]|nr:hypothetical protein [bacterium]